MNFDFTRAMRRATLLTRGRKLREATSIIQEALGWAREDRQPPQGSGPRSQSSQPDPAKELASPSPKTPADVRRARPATGFGPSFRGPLGDVVRALRQARLPGTPAAWMGLHGRVVVPVPDGAEFLTRSFTGPAGSRAYKLYLPRNRGAGPAPLIVMLHGCTQDPDDFATGTRMNLLAEEFGFVVAYPAQPASANPSSCWNWFDPKDQMRDAGEPSIIAGLTREIAARHTIDPRRIFVAGLSAGGAMAAVMGETYPDLYAAIGVHSGLPYRAASDVMTAFAAMRGEGVSRSSRRPDTNRLRAIVFHGDADRTVHPSNGAMFADGHPAAAEDTLETQSGIGNGRSYERVLVRNPDGTPQTENWLINGAGHAWSGGSADGSFTEAGGPDASREMVRFFLEI